MANFDNAVSQRSRSRASLIRSTLEASASAVAVVAALCALPNVALAQTAQTAQAPVVETEIIVTGSRIVRNGYEAPTPVSVMGSEQLERMAVVNIADAINRLPAIQGSAKPQTAQDTFSGATAGVNQLNLRRLGVTRSLVLMDGRRMVGANLSASAVDANNIPNGLVSRVDVVTGGASAAYGSDALAGVINFILDKEYVGVKGDVQGGITTYGDDPSYKVSLTAGTAFSGGKGHFLISSDYSFNKGIAYASKRPWFRNHYFNWIVNPLYGTGAGQTTGVPQYLALDNYGLSVATPGGLITTGPLKGTMFIAGGQPAKFNYGTNVSGIGMQGGDFELTHHDGDRWVEEMLGVGIKRGSLFMRGSYDLSDKVTAFTEIQYAETTTHNWHGLLPQRLGNITITRDNAFIPAEIVQQMTTLGLTSFSLGTWNADGPAMEALNTRIFRRVMAGVEGTFEASETEWSWDASFGRSTTHASARTPNNTIIPKYLEAIDAVRETGTNRIICRSTLTNPTNGCVPFNVMGLEVNTEASAKYFTGTGYQMQILDQNVMAANISGSPFEIWAGSVSIATGIEHRTEGVSTIVTEEDRLSQFYAGNYKATQGKYNVTEGYLETVVPLAKDTAWADSLDLNAAVRATDYSEAGYVTTWKVGATYSPNDSITLRATRSRDIRAPNLSDLFNAGAPGTGTIFDPFRGPGTGLATGGVVSAVEGNINLKPEKANTTGLGVVLQPNFLPGFGASVDYYNIDIKGAVTSLAGQAIVDRCFAGETALCPFIDRGPPAAGQTLGPIVYVHRKSANILSQQTRGIDFEASQNLPLSVIMDDWNGALQFRALASLVLRSRSYDVGIVTEGSGTNFSPSGGFPLQTAMKFRYTGSVAYTTDMFTATVSMRGFGKMNYGNNVIVCQTGCPVSSLASPTYNLNTIDGVRFYDLSLSYKATEQIETFLVVDNVFDTAPPMIAANIGSGFYNHAGPAADYDRTGRIFRAGVRFKM
jgi:iron complex outermembrane recepter protein